MDIKHESMGGHDGHDPVSDAAHMLNVHKT